MQGVGTVVVRDDDSDDSGITTAFKHDMDVHRMGRDVLVNETHPLRRKTLKEYFRTRATTSTERTMAAKGQPLHQKGKIVRPK